MSQPRRTGWLLPLLLAFSLAPAHAAKVEFFDEINTGPRPLSAEEHRYLMFGEAMYDYYRQAPFQAINRLLVNQGKGVFNEDTDYAELVLGDLYVTYGLPQKAEVIFNRLLGKDILSRTRAQTWLHKASLHYREGRLEAAARILDSEKVQGLEPREDAQRRLMMANILMKQGNFTGALDYLDSIPVNTSEGRYATYNAGVALIRAGLKPQGLELLESLVAAGGDNDQELALRDRAALAAGLTRLRDGQLEQARLSLRQVRSNGPFSEDALLALGLVNYRLGKVKRALPLWLETVGRNSSHPSVQEALMLAPRAYEELGAQPQALSGYQYAASEYRRALKDVRRAMDNINQPGWSEDLLPEDLNATGFLPAGSEELARGGELAYLYKLFSSNEFAQRFQHYRQIHQIQTMLNHWQQSLPALSETYRIQQRQLEQGLSQVRGAMTDAISRQETLSRNSDRLAANIPSFLDMDHPEDLGTAEQSIMWQKVDRLTRQFAHLPGANHRNALRLRRIRGLLLWDIAHQSAEQREKQVQDASQLQQDSRVLARRVAAVRRQIRDASHRVGDDLGQRLSNQKQRIDQLQRRTQKTLEDLENSMRADAMAVLQKTQERLADQLAEAHLAIARLQDSSVSGKKKRTGP